MPDAPAGMIEALLSLGLPGVIILALAYVAFQLYRRLNEVQDARLADMRSWSDARAASEQRQAELLAAMRVSLDAAIEIARRQSHG